MAKTKPKSCSFSELLFIWQDDPDLLTEEEWKRLEAHLKQEPPCEECARESVRNRIFFETRDEHFSEMR